MRPGKQLEPFVLERVGVLELVDEDVREAAPVVLAQRVVLRQQLVAAQQQLGEVDDALALARLLVERVVLDLAAREFVVRLDLVRSQSFLLRGVDQRLQLPRGKALVVDVVRLVHALDQRKLVLHVHDLEQLRQLARRGSARAASGCTSPWKVPTHMPRVLTGVSAERRASISFAALLVNVTASTDSGLAWPVASSQAMRVVSTRVLPLPAPARISADACGSVTAASCSGLRLLRRGESHANRARRRDAEVGNGVASIARGLDYRRLPRGDRTL